MLKTKELAKKKLANAFYLSPQSSRCSTFCKARALVLQEVL